MLPPTPLQARNAYQVLNKGYIVQVIFISSDLDYQNVHIYFPFQPGSYKASITSFI